MVMIILRVSFVFYFDIESFKYIFSFFDIEINFEIKKMIMKFSYDSFLYMCVVIFFLWDVE